MAGKAVIRSAKPRSAGAAKIGGPSIDGAKVISLQVRMPPALYAFAENRARYDGRNGVAGYLMALLGDALDQDWRYSMQAEEAAHFRKKCGNGR